MDRGYNDQDWRPFETKREKTATGQDTGQHEVVEFHSEMPRVPDDRDEFIADEYFEEEFNEEI